MVGSRPTGPLGSEGPGCRSSAACLVSMHNSFTQPAREGRAPEGGREFCFAKGAAHLKRHY